MLNTVCPLEHTDFHSLSAKQITTLKEVLEADLYISDTILVNFLPTLPFVLEPKLFRTILEKYLLGQENNQTKIDFLNLLMYKLCMLDCSEIKDIKNFEETFVQIIEVLLKMGADANYEYTKKITEHEHTYQSRIKIHEVYNKFLLHDGLNFEYPNNTGVVCLRDVHIQFWFSPLFMALYAGHLKVVELLLRYNAKPNYIRKTEKHIRLRKWAVDAGAYNDVLKLNPEVKNESIIEAARRLNNQSLVVLLSNAEISMEKLLGKLNSRDFSKFKEMFDLYKVQNSINDKSEGLQNLLSQIFYAIISNVEPKAGDKEKIHDEFYVQVVNFIVELGYNVNIAYKTTVEKSAVESHTSLLLAVKNGRREIVEVLLKNKADTERGEIINNNVCVRTPLMCAVENGDHFTCDLLLRFQAKIHFVNPISKKSIMDSAMSPWKPQIVRLLINAGFPVDTLFEKNETLIFHAIRAHDIETLKLLLLKNAAINIVSFDKYDPLSLSLSNQAFFPVFKLLMDSNKPNETTLYKNLMYAIIANHQQALDCLIQKINSPWPYAQQPSPLLRAIYLKNTTAAEKLIKADRYLDLVDPKSQVTPIHAAMKMELPSIVTLLLEKNPNVNEPSANGWNNFLYACTCSFDILKLVLSRNPNYEETTPNFNNAVFVALKNKKFENAAYFISENLLSIEKTSGTKETILEVMCTFIEQKQFCDTYKLDTVFLHDLRKFKDALTLFLKKGMIIDLKKLKDFSEGLKNFKDYISIAPNYIWKSPNALRDAQSLLVEMSSICEKVCYLFEECDKIQQKREVEPALVPLAAAGDPQSYNVLPARKV